MKYLDHEILVIGNLGNEVFLITRTTRTCGSWGDGEIASAAGPVRLHCH